MRCSRHVTWMAAFAVVSLAYHPAIASTFSGELPVGYSNNLFQINGNSFLTINITASGVRDPAICASCYSSYNDGFTVELFNNAGTLLTSTNESNSFYYNMFGSSKGAGAGPVGISVPAGATTLAIVSQLSIAGLLGANGQPLSLGELFISGNGSITAATPIPSTLPLLGTALAMLGLFGWHRRRKTANRLRAPDTVGSAAFHT